MSKTPMSGNPLNASSRPTRELARDLGISRTTLLGILKGNGNPTLQTLEHIAEQFDSTLQIFFLPKKSAEMHCSAFAISLLIERDGFDSWRIHLMNFVDELRQSRDTRLFFQSPSRSLEKKLQALISSAALHLCDELELSPPDWATEPHFLDQPWFPAGMESLKASAIQESPLAFKQNNIFVLENFLERI